jgi:hypothetical protein
MVNTFIHFAKIFILISNWYLHLVKIHWSNITIFLLVMWSMQCVVQIKLFHKIILKIYKIYLVGIFQLLKPYFNYGVIFKSSFHLAFKATIIIVSKVFSYRIWTCALPMKIWCRFIFVSLQLFATYFWLVLYIYTHNSISISPCWRQWGNNLWRSK